MTDIVDKETRSRMMAAVKGKNTGPELRLRKLLWESGIRGYRLHRKDVAGRPDLAWIGRRVAVFVDGAFWHGHPKAFTVGKSGPFWDKKISANIERDRRVNQELSDLGWVVVRVWDFEIKNDSESAVSRIREALSARPAPTGHRRSGSSLPPSV